MKTTKVDFVKFAQDAMTLTEMNFLRGGGNPDHIGEDLLIPPSRIYS